MGVGDQIYTKASAQAWLELDSGLPGQSSTLIEYW